VKSVRELARASMAAVESGDREEWLALFAEDAVVEDPIGPSMFDPEGAGHRGTVAIAAFYDGVIAANEAIRFDIRQSFLCGDEIANVGVIRITLTGGTAVEVDGVYTYRRSPEGKIAALRAYWEPESIRAVEQGTTGAQEPDRPA
jgi:steroid Delta-isomerase